MREIRLYRAGGPDCSIRAQVADNFFRRFCGLMGRRGLAADEGLLLEPCRSVHMCFMRFAIDVVYLVPTAGGYRVVKVVRHLRPWYGLSACREAVSALELPAGALQRYQLQPGDHLLLA